MTLVITARQQDALNFIAGYLRSHRKAPSYREIGRALGVKSLASVQRHLYALESRGLIRRNQETSWRAWELTELAQIVL